MNERGTYHVLANRPQPHEQQWHLSVLPSAPSHVCAALEMPIPLPQNDVSCPSPHLEQWSTAADRTGAEWHYMHETYKESLSGRELVNCPLTLRLSQNCQMQMNSTWRQHQHQKNWELI